MIEKKKIRSPAVAGMFYENSPDVLRNNIVKLLDKAHVPASVQAVCGIVAPHAGYIYSGQTAAHAYKILKGKKYDCIVAIGPSHREYFDGISVYPGDAYRTPLGEVPVNCEIRSELINSNKSIFSADEGHRMEHSVEVQLPFLQFLFKDLSFVPVIMGDQRRELCYELSDALAKVLEHRNVLMVASSDLSHYHPAGEAEMMDKKVIRAIEKFDPDAFISSLEEESFEACGGGPVAVVMKTALKMGAKRAEVLNYSNSGDITGDRRSVVGYLAAAFYGIE